MKTLHILPQVKDTLKNQITSGVNLSQNVLIALPSNTTNITMFRDVKSKDNYYFVISTTPT